MNLIILSGSHSLVFNFCKLIIVYLLRSGDGGKALYYMLMFSARKWCENFCLSKETFNYLCTQPSQYSTYTIKICICEKQSLSRTMLLSPCELCHRVQNIRRTVSHLFGGQSTFFEIHLVQETCQAIVDHLLPKYMRFPSTDQQQQYIDSFETKWGVLQCIGAIDGSHIPVSPPPTPYYYLTVMHTLYTTT